MAFQMAAMQRDTHANILASTGHYVGEEAYANDYGIGRGLELYWNGSAWKLSTAQQLMGIQHTAVSCDADTNEKTLYTVNIPPMGPNSQLMIRTMWSFTNSANNKTVKWKFGGTTVYSNNVTTSAIDVRDWFFRNRNATNAQVLGYGNSGVYGVGTATLATSAIETNAGGALTITGQKANSGEVLTLESVDVFIIGGGS